MTAQKKDLYSGKLLDYPFDLYQRTRDICEIVDIIAAKTGKEKLSILDVGGYRVDAEDRGDLLLREFLPQHDIISLDLIDSGIDGYVRGDGTNLPFKDNSFDIAVSSDVFEHVPSERRNAFVDNLTRVAASFVILGAPFYSEKNQLAEKLLFEYVRKVLHADQEQLKEHIENRLPDGDALNSFLDEKQLPFIQLKSGNLENWIMMMMVKHYFMTIPGSEELHVMADRFYNMSSYASDHHGECYRKIYVLSVSPNQSGNWLNEIDARFMALADEAKNKVQTAVDGDLGRFRLLLDLEELRTRRLLDEKDDLIKRQAEEIQALNRLRSTTFFKFARFIKRGLLRPFRRTGRFVLNKLVLAGQVLSGKRKHPWFSVSDNAYRRWIAAHSPSQEQIEDMKEESGNFGYRPLISIVMPVYNTAAQWLEEAIDSVKTQVYDHWELCVVNDGSSEKHVRGILDRVAKEDTRIRVTHLRRNIGIAGATNRALAAAKGEFIAFMDSDDTLHPLALYEIVKHLNSYPDTGLVFTDEDKLGLDGLRRKPVFKPGWDPELFLTYNYINHLTVCRKDLVDKVGGFNKQYDWSQDYDLYLRITELTTDIHHIPRVLYHWRAVPGSSAHRVDFRTEALEKSRQLLADTLHRRGIKAVVADGLRPGTFKIKKI